MNATIKDVAKVAGVSFKTVSRVINREPSVADELRARVWKAIEELDYQPNLSARQLRGAASCLAFIYDNVNSHCIIEMQNGMLAECNQQGFELLIHPVDASADDYIAELRRVANNSHVAGLVLAPPFSESERLAEALRKQAVQFIRILSSGSQSAQPGPCVYVDDYRAAYAVTDYLLRLGHRSIGFLGGPLQERCSQQRLAGYRAALADHGTAAAERLILPGEYSFESGNERTRHLLTMRAPPTAVIAGNDDIAAGALFAARNQQVAVPQQLSIAGFEDSPFSRQSWPRLTTTHQPNRAIAQAAANLLINAIRATRQGNSLDAIRDKGFQPHLVVRDSTCAAPA
jgi:LacI family transcriptional regulator